MPLIRISNSNNLPILINCSNPLENKFLASRIVKVENIIQVWNLEKKEGNNERRNSSRI